MPTGTRPTISGLLLETLFIYLKGTYIQNYNHIIHINELQQSLGFFNVYNIKCTRSALNIKLHVYALIQKVFAYF